MENGRRVLVAQSDTKSALELRSLLLRCGWDVLMANDALQAFSIAIREKPVVVVASVELAGGGGLSLLNRIRNSAHTARISVIGVGGRDDKRKQEFLTAGALGFLERPVTIGSLPEALRGRISDSPEMIAAPASSIATGQQKASQHQRVARAYEPALFDDLSHFAANLLSAPSALLSLIDKNRQFFSSQSGTASIWADPRRASLFYSFCQLAVCSRNESVVPDTRNNEGLLASLGLRELGIVAYAVAPITLEGELIGTLSAVDHKPHKWTDDDLNTLRDLSKIAETYVSLKEASRAGSGPKITNGSRSQNPAARYIDSAEGCISRILERSGRSIDAADRAQLLGTVQRLTERRSQTAGAHS